MSNYKWINKVMAEPTPCDGCIHNTQCADKKMACFAFTLYVNSGDDNWSLPRKPSRILYLLTMANNVNLNRQINIKLKELA